MRGVQHSTRAKSPRPNIDDQAGSNAYPKEHGGEFQYRLLMAQRRRKIEQAAYFTAEHRGFVPGLELHDWLEAEQEVDKASRPIE